MSVEDLRGVLNIVRNAGPEGAAVEDVRAALNELSPSDHWTFDDVGHALIGLAQEGFLDYVSSSDPDDIRFGLSPRGVGTLDNPE